MAQFCMKIAGHVACVTSLFDSTPQYFKAYLTQEPAEFSIIVQPQQLLFEQQQLDAEAAQEGFRRRQFTDPFLERTAIQRSFAEYLFDRDILLLHGSALALDGKGYLFAARSGTGKSTHTRLWQAQFGQRVQMINDDKPFLQVTDDGITMFGAPWSGKHGLDTNISVPLQGICLLSRGAENHIEPADAQQLLTLLRHQGYWPMDEAKHDRYLALTEKLISQVTIWHLSCTKDPQAALVASGAMHT